ncbi:MAG: hypothetical protein HPY76_02415 [Anaerolineae bacterium]|nr:hypothetical protein [Anaerolineae bacterium]
MSDELGFSMMRLFNRLYRSAWAVVAMMLIGAVAGWLLHQVMPARYEATASITTSIDYSRTGILTDLEEDQSIVAIGDLIRSASVMDQVLQRADARAVDIMGAGMDRVLFLDRVGYRWVLRARLDDPNRAHDLVNLWAAVAIERLNEAQSHAEAAAALERQQALILDCLEQVPAANPAAPLCADLSRADLQGRLAELGRQLQAERQASSGLYPAMLVSLDQPAEVSSHPTRYAGGEMVLAGAVLGFILAVIALESGAFDRLKKLIARDR